MAKLTAEQKWDAYDDLQRRRAALHRALDRAMDGDAHVGMLGVNAEKAQALKRQLERKGFEYRFPLAPPTADFVRHGFVKRQGEPGDPNNEWMALNERKNGSHNVTPVKDAARAKDANFMLQPFEATIEFKPGVVGVKPWVCRITRGGRFVKSTIWETKGGAEAAAAKMHAKIVTTPAKDSSIPTWAALLALLYAWAHGQREERVGPQSYDLTTYQPRKRTW